jgi:hypothetical protein
MTANEKIPWKRLSVEAVAIVGSILLAFAIDAWWDDKSQRAAEFEYLVNLHEDFLGTQEMLADQIKYIEDRFRYVDRILEVIGNHNMEVPPEDFSLLLGQAYDARTVALPAATYQDMINSGNLRLIRNQSLRSNIARLVALLREIEDHSRLINESYWNYHAPFVGRNAIETDFGWYREDNTDSNIEVVRMVGTSPMSPFDIDIRAFQSREFWNLIFEWKVLYADQLSPVLKARNYCKEVVLTLEKLIENTSDY